MKLDKEFYTSHIQDDSYLLKMRQILDNVEMAINNHRVEATDFLDPYERHLAKSILNRFEDIEYLEDGGLDESERKIIIIYPYYFNKEDVKEKLSFLKVELSNVHTLHKDFLGAILNLGITREKVGDLYLHNGYTFIVVKNEVKDFLLYNLQKVSNYNVKIVEAQRNELESSEEDYVEVNNFVSSLRLDVVLSAIYKISRQNSLKLIKSDRIKINFKPVNKPYIELSEGDLISARGYGRANFHSINGTSKKGNYNITIRILT